MHWPAMLKMRSFLSSPELPIMVPTPASVPQDEWKNGVDKGRTRKGGKALVKCKVEFNDGAVLIQLKTFINMFKRKHDFDQGNACANIFGRGSDRDLSGSPSCA